MVETAVAVSQGDTRPHMRILPADWLFVWAVRREMPFVAFLGTVLAYSSRIHNRINRHSL